MLATSLATTLVARAAQAQPLPALVAISATATACQQLHTLRLPDVKLTEVFDDHDSVGTRDDRVAVPHCRVRGVIGKGTEFVVMPPTRWNQRLLMTGNGGYAGTINPASLASATAGYVTVNTNTGHEASPGGGARWALNDPERVLDYGHVAVHRTAEVARVLAKAMYGSEPAYAYFDGCSNGGRQALMEAQRYPDDFDGIIAGAPAAHFSRVGAAFLKNTRAAFPTPAYFDKPLVTQANLDLLSAKVLEACDALDGVTDGILEDPRACRFNLATIKGCPVGRAVGNCLTAAQRAAIAAIYAPTAEGRRVVYPGQPFGGEHFEGGWPQWITGRDTALMRTVHVPSLQAMFTIEGAKYITFNDTTWDYTRYRGAMSTDSRLTALVADATDPDLRKFAARKGKLILWHGWSDPALNPLATIDYHDDVLKTDPSAKEYVRLFLAPGVLHCGGGPGPSSVAWLRTLEAWREQAQVPQRVVATKRDSTGKVTRSRPLCAYPQHAVYTGSGSTDAEENFVCRAP